jgi:MoxR-like ATPase
MDADQILQEVIKDLSELPKGSELNYISGRGKISDIVVDEDSNNITLKDADGDAHTIGFPRLKVVAEQLSRGGEVHVQTAYQGGGSDSGLIETLYAHTTHVGWKKVNRKKHLLWLPYELHPVGTLLQLDGSDWTNPEWALAVLIYERVVKARSMSTIPAPLPAQLALCTAKNEKSWQARIANLRTSEKGGGFDGGAKTKAICATWIARSSTESPVVESLASKAFSEGAPQGAVEAVCKSIGIVPPSPVLVISPDIGMRWATNCSASKPFLILTGNSGTGKTKLAERLAETYRDNDDVNKSGNYAVVAVGADWTDNRSVVGFVNHLREASSENTNDKRPVYQSTPVLDLLLHANQHENWPHFLILDEMNLSHVERYFADFLSAMEARDGVLRLHSEGPADQPDYRLPRSDGDKIGVPRQLAYPENLFVIGTVNVDETTYMFSPKVLDRAHVIEFEVDPKTIEAFLEKPEPLLPAPRAAEPEAFGFLQLSKDARAIDGGSVEPLPSAVAAKINAHLMAVLHILQRARFEFAFRTANEVNTYLRVCRQLANDQSAWESDGWKTDLDDEILQKILPRLHGSRARVGNLVGALVCYFAIGKKDEALQFFPADGQEEAARTLTDAVTFKTTSPEFSRCFKKMQTMARVLVEEQFVSFIC